jgi:hypothetical protein
MSPLSTLVLPLALSSFPSITPTTFHLSLMYFLASFSILMMVTISASAMNNHGSEASPSLSRRFATGHDDIISDKPMI